MSEISRRATLALLSATALSPVAGCATAPEAAPADQSFEGLSARALDAMARQSPVYATQLGDHRFDAELDDFSEAGRRSSAATRRALQAELGAIDKTRLSAAGQVDASMLANQLSLDAWREETSEAWAWDPLPYNEVAGGALYNLMARDFAPLPERLNNAALRMQKLPGLFAQARANLDLARVPRVHAETLSRQNAGVVSIAEELILPHADALGPSDRARLNAAVETLRASVAEHQTWIDGTLVPGARGDFRIGAQRYDEKLALALNSTLSRAEIKTRAESEIERIRGEMAEIAGQIVTPPANERWTAQRMIAQALERAYADRPARNEVVQVCEASLARCTNFVREHDLMTLPDAPVNVILMPEFQRGVAVAYCDSPGALDRGQATFYAVSPIPDDWTDEQTASFLKEYNNHSIQELTVHEAMPGHYAQIWHSNRYPSTLRAALSSGVFVEGWACYAQDMMIASGSAGDDLLARLVNLKWALRVVSNAILDQAVHVDGMSREEAMQLMTETTFQQEREAAGKWVRASVSSAQLPTYFIGWTEHHALRREAEQRWGTSFTQKRYHDTVLSFGSPPVRHARALMFGEAIG
ncbi:MAG: DUF885 domain-containing protein [Terricaulis sp.]